MSLEEQICISYNCGKAIWNKGRAAITLSNRVLDNLRYYYDTPIFDTYYACLCSYPLEAAKEKLDNYFYITDKGFIQIWASVKDKVQEMTKSIPESAESSTIDSITAFPYLDSVPYHTYVLPDTNRYIIELLQFLHDFWKKDLKEIPCISKSISQNYSILEKFTKKLQEIFNIKDCAINSVLNRNTDVQFLCSMVSAGFLTPVNILK